MTPNKRLLLDIGMNMSRIGGWICEDYSRKKKRIAQFLSQTSHDLSLLSVDMMPTPGAKQALKRFKNEYPLIESAILSTSSPNLIIAERMLTWGNILTHKASLITT